jgi:homoserine dehydrogenase
MNSQIVVLKFGSSVLRGPADLPWAVQQIYAHVRRGERVVAVVSAFAGVTDALYARAREHGADECATAALVATGESESAALLALALDRCGVPARLLQPAGVQFRTRGPVLDAEPADVDGESLRAALAQRPVVVFPGFCGLDDDGHTTLLGRGGSDLTALFLAEKLDARCVLVKDVDGLYERDPALPGPPPARFERLTWEDALRVGGKVVQPKTLRTARLHGRTIDITAIGAARTTVVGPHAPVLSPAAPRRPLRVVLLGLGTVGGGVHERLTQRPDLFEIAAIAVRDPSRHAARGVPPDLLTADPYAAIAADADVVVEALGGVSPAADLLHAALRAGRHVVTANKAALAAHYERFAPYLAGDAPRLRASASVGGAVPVLEALAKANASGVRVTGVRGVVNGTCNYVLDRLAEGLELGAAIAEAQAAGYAEPDPTSDVSGQDAAHKLRLLVALASGAVPDRFDVQGLDEATAEAQRDAIAAGRRVKLVASWNGAARVGLESLAAGDPLARTRGEENAIELEFADGTRRLLTGRGAGRAPTTTAVVADLLDALADLQARVRAGAQTGVPVEPPAHGRLAADATGTAALRRAPGGLS